MRMFEIDGNHYPLAEFKGFRLCKGAEGRASFIIGQDEYQIIFEDIETYIAVVEHFAKSYYEDSRAYPQVIHLVKEFEKEEIKVYDCRNNRVEYSE